MGSTKLIKGKRTVIAFGRNDFGQLGVGDTENRRFPTQVKDLNFQSCHILEAGDLHSAFLNDKNELFMWGNNEFGQLGMGTQVKMYNTPQKVNTQDISDNAAQFFDSHNSKIN